MANPAIANGKICYIEIPSTDITESSTFYTKAFGWQVKPRGDGTLAFNDTVGQVSGTWRTDRTPQTDLGMLFYIMVLDIDASLKAVVENGGKILQHANRHAPEIIARITDPSGNMLGLYQQKL